MKAKDSFNPIGDLIKPNIIKNMSEDMIIFLVSHLTELLALKVISEISYETCITAINQFRIVRNSKFRIIDRD